MGLVSVNLEGIDYDCEYEIEERGYPSNGWDDAGAATIVCVLTVDGVIAKQVPSQLVELLEEAIGAMYDSGEMDDGPEDY